MKIYKYIALGVIAMAAGSGMTSCVGDLDITPDDPNKITELSSKEQWLGYFGTVYGNLIFEGNLTPQGVNAGAGTWSRCHWNLQELSADGVILYNSWNDPGYPDLKTNTWGSDNTWGYMCFQREATTARQCVEFINKIKGASAFFTDDEIKAMVAEANTVKALNYYYMIDLFGKGPWVDESVGVGEVPPTYDRKQLFEATVNTLIEAIPDLKPAAQQEYGRVSQEAARMLLAKLYLNAEVYVGTPMYDKCAEQCKKILETVNTLAPDYRFLFCQDNDQYVGGNNEILWSLPSDAVTAQNYGGTTYLTAGAYFADIDREELATLGNPHEKWNGLKVKPELVNAFEPGDKRALFYAGSFNLGVEDLSNTGADGDGYMCVKYTFTYSDDYNNELGKHPAPTTRFSNSDSPLFRLADTYLMLAECQVRGVSGADPGFTLFNKVRARAGLAPKTAVTLNDILNERTCELYWEGHRRSDLIRFGLFTGSTYNWSWKGGVAAGTGIADYRKLFAIPYQYVGTVGQNPGY